MSRHALNFGVVLDTPHDFQVHLDSYKASKKKNLKLVCTVEGCPKQQEGHVVENISQMDQHQWKERCPIERKSCRVNGCPEFGIVSANTTVQAAHRNMHKQQLATTAQLPTTAQPTEEARGKRKALTLEDDSSIVS